MRIGTLRCLLFGHKFAKTAEWEGMKKGYVETRKFPFCIRCGMPFPKLIVVNNNQFLYENSIERFPDDRPELCENCGREKNPLKASPSDCHCEEDKEEI